VLIDDPESCYLAVKSRDRRFDGVFYTAVRSTGIYCRPSCPAITPRRHNVVFHRTAAAAQQAGFRACKRCRPDATPGSPEWDVAADTAGRAMRLISDGLVERAGVEGLASKVGYTSRHLSRILVKELGAGPLALARARRAQTARTLIETTSMSFAEVAFAAGFSSIRQFNDTVREVYAATPTQLRSQAAPVEGPSGVLELRLAVRPPFAAAELLGFLAVRAVPGVEETGPDWYSRTLRLPHDTGAVRLALDEAAGRGTVRCTLRLRDLRDLAAAVERCRRLLDADCDPEAVDAALSSHPVLGPRVGLRPGLRVPGHVDGDEVAVRAVLGQQVSVARAQSLAALLVERYAEPVGSGTRGEEVRLFPSAASLAEVDPDELPMPRARGRALVVLSRALARGEVALDRSAPRDEVRRALLELPGIGPWTAGYIAMRALGDPDVFLDGDVGVRQGLLGLGVDPRRAERVVQAWRPWRSYAQMHVWQAAKDAAYVPGREGRPGDDGKA
jgi:AraC family transcriptional regulator, regulatory protein of adaptative response / DNA-3-methyladenine glycosylase II